MHSCGLRQYHVPKAKPTERDHRTPLNAAKGSTATRTTCARSWPSCKWTLQTIQFQTLVVSAQAATSTDYHVHQCRRSDLHCHVWPFCSSRNSTAKRQPEPLSVTNAGSRPPRPLHKMVFWSKIWSPTPSYVMPRTARARRPPSRRAKDGTAEPAARITNRRRRVITELWCWGKARYFLAGFSTA